MSSALTALFYAGERHMLVKGICHASQRHIQSFACAVLASAQ